jgi:signal transduction histidine kinase
MSKILRRTGIDPIGAMPWGSHLCLFYDTAQDLLDALVPYFKAGLEAGELCVWAVSEPLTERAAEEALASGIPEFFRYRAAGSIEIVSGRDWYLRGGSFDRERVTEDLRNRLSGALARGYEGLRVSGDSVWVEKKDWLEVSEYEWGLGETLSGRPVLALCTYPIGASRAVDILDVVRAHQFTVARRHGQWEFIETPELRQAKEEIRALNEELDRRVAERTRQLGAANEELRAEIANRNRVEEDLRRSEAYLAEGQRLTHTGSWHWNIASGRVYWSREHFHIFGFDPAAGEPSAETALSRVHPEDRPGLDQAVAEAIAHRRDFNHVYRLVFPDGTIRHVQSIGHPAIGASGEIELTGTVMDVSERQHAEEALADAQTELARVMRSTAMGELAASIAHEINQPLAAVVANGEASLRWLAMQPPNLEEAREAGKRIVRDANRAGEVIKGIRALLARDKQQFAPLDINEAIREVLMLTRGELDRHQIAVQTELSSALPPILGDRIQLQQVVLNLTLNAIDAMRTVSERRRLLSIASQPSEDGKVLVQVEDCGIGLVPGFAEAIFEPFFSTKPDGMGMGLSICRSIVEVHGGRLSAAPGSKHGTVFTCTLPAASRDPP